MNAPLPVFLTAYDPAELPGGTVDPLGFTAGYLVLADLLFPGMTAAAAQASYLPMLCAGLAIADEHGGAKSLTPAAARKQRIEVGLRFERLWALAAALQLPQGADAEPSETETPSASKVAGLRGITYVAREAERLTRALAKTSGSEFPLLAQQYRYGAFGIYGGVAEQLRLLDKSSFAPSPGFGSAIGLSFLETTTDTAQRKELIEASLSKSTTLRLSTLTTWGSRSYPGAPLRGDALKLLAEAAKQNPERERTLALVERVVQKSGTEQLLDMCARQADEAAEPVLFAALKAAVAYDDFLRHYTLIFERVLWLCRQMKDAEQTAVVFADTAVVQACSSLAASATGLLEASQRLLAHGRRELSLRGRGVLDLAKQAQTEAGVAATVRAVLRRHAEIQRGKFEQGRPKQAWIEERGSEFVLTSARIGLRSGEPETLYDVRGPDWRFNAALSLLTLTGRAPRKAAP